MADIIVVLTIAQLTRALDAFKLKSATELGDEWLGHIRNRVLGEESNKVRDPAGDVAVEIIRTELINEGWQL